jgi:hypothetical protein
MDGEPYKGQTALRDPRSLPPDFRVMETQPDGVFENRAVTRTS